MGCTTNSFLKHFSFLLTWAFRVPFPKFHTVLLEKHKFWNFPHHSPIHNSSKKISYINCSSIKLLTFLGIIIVKKMFTVLSCIWCVQVIILYKLMYIKYLYKILRKFTYNDTHCRMAIATQYTLFSRHKIKTVQCSKWWHWVLLNILFLLSHLHLGVQYPSFAFTSKKPLITCCKDFLTALRSKSWSSATVAVYKHVSLTSKLKKISW